MPKPIEHYVEKLHSFKPEERFGALNKMVKFGKEAGPHVLPMLGDAEKEISHAAARVLGEIKYEEAIPQLITMATNIDTTGWDPAGKALAKMSEKSLPRLLDILKNHPDENWRDGVAYSLRFFEPEQVYDPLIEALKDENKSVKSTVFETMGEIKHEGPIPHLIPFVNGSDGELSINALNALGNIGGTHGLAGLIKAHEEAEKDWQRKRIEKVIKKLIDEGVDYKDLPISSLLREVLDEEDQEGEDA